MSGDFKLSLYGPSGNEISSGLFNTLKQLIETYFGAPAGTAYVPYEQDDSVGNGDYGYGYGSGDARRSAANSSQVPTSTTGRGIETLVPG